MNEYLALLLGLVCAGVGGELFLRGTLGLATAVRISPGIIAATVAAFATSSPELTVAIISALEGQPEISLGNALGSNIVNIAVILAVVTLLSPIAVPRTALRRDYPIALLIPVLLGVVALDGQVSRFDALLLLGSFSVWLIFMIADAHRERSAAPEILAEKKPTLALLEGGIGAVLLVVAGKLIVDGASSIALNFGLSEFVVGATVVAIGTTVPELATALISRLRGHDEVGLGTILGSNVLNGLFIVGVASSIEPIPISLAAAAPALIVGLVSVVLIFPGSSGVIPRWRGMLLLVLYLAYLSSILLLGIS